MLSLNAQVKRDGEWQQIAAEDLVPGDIVRIKSGDKVPADMRLLESVNLRVEESALTGEAVPTEKSVEPSPPIPEWAIAPAWPSRAPWSQPAKGLSGHRDRR